MNYDDLLVVAEVVVLRHAPGSGEADRVAHVRKLLDLSAELSYAASTYAHRVLLHSRRRPPGGDVRDETAVLQDALDAFGEQVRVIADAYRALVTAEGKQVPPSSPIPGLAQSG